MVFRHSTRTAVKRATESVFLFLGPLEFVILTDSLVQQPWKHVLRCLTYLANNPSHLLWIHSHIYAKAILPKNCPSQNWVCDGQ